MSLTDEQMLDIAKQLDDKRLDELVAEVSSTAAPGGVARGALPEENLRKLIPYCKEYCTGRPLLVLALKVIERIPFFGSKAAKLIRLLMATADEVCACETGIE